MVAIGARGGFCYAPVSKHTIAREKWSLAIKLPDWRSVSDKHVARCELPGVGVLKLPNHNLAVMASRHHCSLVAQQVNSGDTVGRGGAPPEDDRDHQVGGARHLNPAPLCNQNLSFVQDFASRIVILAGCTLMQSSWTDASKKVQK